MNLKIKDIIILVVVILLSFPLVFFGILLGTGNARLEFGPALKEVIDENKLELTKVSPKLDSLSVRNLKTFQAMVRESADLEKERQRLQDEHRSLEMFQNDLEAKKAELRKEHQQIENLVSQSDTLSRKKAAQQAVQLAKVYSAMRPAEAAQIISTLKDELAARILDGISDDRQKAKILAALPSDKASVITLLMGGNVRR